MIVSVVSDGYRKLVRNPMDTGMDINFYRGYNHRRILVATVDMIADGYLQYPIRIRSVANPTHKAGKTQEYQTVGKESLEAGMLAEFLVRLSASVTPKFFPLYHFLGVTSSTFYPLCFHLPQRFSLKSPLIPHYNYKISLFNPIYHLLSFFLQLLNT